MELLNLLSKEFLCNTPLNADELNQIVSYINNSIESINTLIEKENLINSGHCEIRYKNSSSQPSKPANGSNGNSGGWSSSSTTPNTSQGECTWMTLSFVNGDGVYGEWSTPVGISWGSVSGNDGNDGNDGLPGPFKSRVFKRLNSRPDTPTGGTYDNPIPSGWYDSVPQGSAIIWSSICTFYGDGISSGWSTPAQESDTATLDVEFSPSLIQPNPPEGNIPFLNHEIEGWYDPNSSNFDTAGTMIWRAERKVANGVYSGDWTISRILGEAGNNGKDGNGVEYVFIRTNTEEVPSITNSNDTYLNKTYLNDDYLPLSSAGRCTDDPTGVDTTHRYEWVAKRVKDEPDSLTGIRQWKKYSGQMALWSIFSESVITADLDNEMDSISCDKKGKPVISQSVSTVINLHYGSTLKEFNIVSVKRNGITMTLGTASNGVTIIYDANTHTLTITYAVSAIINGKDEYKITIRDASNSSITRTLIFTVNGMVGDVYNLLPGDRDFAAQRTSNGGYVVNGSSTVTLKCGYTKNTLGTITTVDSCPDGIVDSKYNIFYRRRRRSDLVWEMHNGSSAVWEGDYNPMYRRLLSDESTLNIDTYDAIEIVLTAKGSNNSYYAPVDIEAFDREKIYVVADGLNGEDGENGTIITECEIKYAASSNGQTPPTGSGEGPGIITVPENIQNTTENLLITLKSKINNDATTTTVINRVIRGTQTFKYLSHLVYEANEQYYNATSPHGLPLLFLKDNFPTLIDYYGNSQNESQAFNAMIGWVAASLLTELRPDLRNILMAAGYNIGPSKTTFIYQYEFRSDPNIARLVGSAICAAMRGLMLPLLNITISSMQGELRLNGDNFSFNYSVKTIGESNSYNSDYYIAILNILPVAPGPYFTGYTDRSLVGGIPYTGTGVESDYNLTKDLLIHNFVVSNYNSATDATYGLLVILAIADKENDINHLFGDNRSIITEEGGLLVTLTFHPVFGQDTINYRVVYPVNSATADIVPNIKNIGTRARTRLQSGNYYGRRRPGESTTLDGQSKTGSEGILASFTIETNDGCAGAYKKNGDWVYSNSSNYNSADYKAWQYANVYANSYPSGHSSGIWAVALFLMELRPHSAALIMKAANLYAVNRLITRYHWNSDTIMGRLVGAIISPVIRASTDYESKLILAKSENGENISSAVLTNGWVDSIAETGITKGLYLWTRRRTFYSDNREPTVEYSVSYWGSDGSNSSAGRTDVWYVYAGEWGTVTSVTNSTNTYYYVKYNDDFYMNTMAAENPNTNTPGETGWERMANYNYFITKAIFSNYASLGSFCINKDWMLSQHGTIYDSNGQNHDIDEDSLGNPVTWNGYSKENAYQLFDPEYPTSSKSGVNNFVPNFAVDGKTGKVYMNKAFVKGNINATSGSFTGDIHAQGGDITGDLIIGSGNNKIYILPNGTNGALIVGKKGSTEKFLLGFNSNGDAYFSLTVGDFKVNIYDGILMFGKYSGGSLTSLFTIYLDLNGKVRMGPYGGSISNIWPKYSDGISNLLSGEIFLDDTNGNVLKVKA